MAYINAWRGLVVLGALGAWALLPLARADAESFEPEPRERTADGEGWQLTATPLAWRAEQHGTLRLNGIGASADIDLSDLSDVLDVVASLGLELRNDDFAFQLDGLYLSIDEDARRSLGDVDVGLKQIFAQSLLSYRVLNEPFSMDLLVGARYARVDVDLDFARTRDWVDPVVGVRVRTGLTDRLAFSFHGDLGGFGVGSGSDHLWSVAATFIYGWDERWSFSLGYDLLSYDYDEGAGAERFEYNVKQRGPSFGISYRF